MPRFVSLLPVTDADLVPNADRMTRKRKLASNSTPPSTSSSMNQKENGLIDDFLSKKRTKPQPYCPRSRPPTQQAPAPVSTHARRPVSKAEDDAKLKIFLDSRPHFRVERKLEAEESEDMKVLKAFRRRDFLAAQEAKKKGGFREEPKTKKRRAAVPKPFWMKN